MNKTTEDILRVLNSLEPSELKEEYRAIFAQVYKATGDREQAEKVIRYLAQALIDKVMFERWEKAHG